MSADTIQTVITGASAFAGALVGMVSLAVWLTWWLARRFANVYVRIQDVKDQLVDKIDAHENLDAERFKAHELSIMRLELKQQEVGKPLYGM